MKKILLSLMCLVGFMVANAAEVSITFSEQGYANAEEVASVALDDNVTLVFDKGTNSNTPKYYNTGKALRIYGGGTMTVQGASGVTINSVTMTTGTGSYVVSATSSVSAGTLTINGGTAAIAGINAQSTVFTQGGTSGHVRIVSVVVDYTAGVATSANTPVITPNGGEVAADTEISISCTTDGASIYYTIDGTEPSNTNGILYAVPFKLTSATTVKAIAYADGLSQSSVASADFTFPVANIAEFISEAREAATTIAGAVTVVAQSGSYLFVQDETARIVVFGSVGQTFNNGDQLKGIKGTYSLYNGLPEMNSNSSLFAAVSVTAGAAVEPEVVTIEEVAIDNLLAYVKLTGVTISGSDKTYTIEDETGSMTMYNSAGITVPTGENMTVIGFISCYKTTVQILPVEITSASGLEVVETPEIAPAGGAIAPTQEITLTCATEGASIYYTLDGTEPSQSSTLYEAPFTLAEECTVKAIAYADGMEASAVAEAAFTFMSDDVKVATFDFTNPTSLNPVQETPAVGGNVVVNDVVFTSGDISLVCVKGESASTDCRLWGGSSVVDLRTYKTSTITISGESVNITSIEFTGSKASDAQLTPDTGTLTDKVWMSADSANQVVFTTTATTNIQTITVYYEGATDGVESIEGDFDLNAPVEYYNLQGVKIINPKNGLYIKVQGNKVSKVLVK